VGEYLGFIAEARLIRANERKQAIGASIAACGLEQVRSKRIEALSKGYRQRVGLAQAIIHDPPILILDEPTSGLDPNQIIEIRRLIKDLGKRKTVILSTHILQEVEAICSQVLILNEGRIAAQGTPEEIASTLKGGDTWELLLKGDTGEGLKNRLTRFGASRGLELSSLTMAPEEDAVRLSFFLGNTSGEAIFDWAVAEGLKILMMNRKRLSLEDIFVKLTNDEGIGQQLSNDESIDQQLSNDEDRAGRPEEVTL
jgi:ABC-2 type transport system ATP-binding protein